jgi:hypothetical protein
MSTFVSGKAIKGVGLLLIILFLIFACSDDKHKQSNTQKAPNEEERLKKEYDLALSQAQNNDPAGLLRLYQIASESRSAEMSEIARDKLAQFLYSKSELWVKTFSRTDSDKFKNYLRKGGLAVLDLPKEVASEEEFKEEILKKLKRIKGDEKEKELIQFIFQLYQR